MPLELAFSQIIFYVFAFVAVMGAVGVVSFRNPVSSAMSMALCFVSVAAIYFGMGAEFMGIIQIIVYAGAILVLFLFVIMMLDVKAEEERRPCLCTALVGTIVAGVFAGLVVNIAMALPGAKEGPCAAGVIWNSLTCSECTPCCAKEEAACATPSSNYGGQLPAMNTGDSSDTKLFGETLYTDYNIQLAILSFALLSACVGSIAISRKLRKD